MTVYFTKRRKIMSNQTKNGYVSLIKYVILQIITLGIYQWVWIYKTTNYLNTAKVKIRNAKTELLLCIFLPFYSIYWLYASNEIVNNLFLKRNGTSLLTFFLSYTYLHLCVFLCKTRLTALFAVKKKLNLLQ